MNRLTDQSSPYLRMHADDPVDWWPWGAEAVAEAHSTGRAIFLSIGYASCHWCHVMQRESFRDPETANILNNTFVPVKVDRESRPDIDRVYMDFVVATEGSGGWPLNVFITPDGIPVFGGSYYPAEPHGKTQSFKQILSMVGEAWVHKGFNMMSVAVANSTSMHDLYSPADGDDVGPEQLRVAAQTILKAFAPDHGGFGRAPKFPLATAVMFLEAYRSALRDDAAALGGDIAVAVDTTLSGMLRGGIYDQAGGGVARYALDRAWLVPHFEKMLPDNALLLSEIAGALGFGDQPGIGLSESHERLFGHAARQTARFLSRDLASPGGGFMSSLSADSGGVEGAAYVWTYDELADTLTPGELALAEQRLGVTPGGNWEGHTILTRPEGVEPDDVDAVDAVLDKLLAARRKRLQPEPDTKVLTDWNALAARGLIEAGRALPDSAILSAGLDLTTFLIRDAIRDDGVVHVLNDATDAGVRIADDATALEAAALAAFEATQRAEFLDAAKQLHADTLGRFAVDGVVYMTPADTDLPARPLDHKDEPTPSAAATAAENAVKLGVLTGEPEYLTWARTALHFHRSLVDAAPSMTGTALTAAVRLSDAQRAAD